MVTYFLQDSTCQKEGHFSKKIVLSLLPYSVVSGEFDRKNWVNTLTSFNITSDVYKDII